MKRLILALLFYPVFAQAQDTISLVHQRYTTTFDKILLYPVKVHWVVTSNDYCAPHTSRRVERKNSYFKKDPALPGYTNLQQFYTNNVGHYERGHNMDAADNSCDLQQMKECHYFSNITPQTVELNEHVWGDLEDYTRDLVKQYRRVEIWCGSYGNNGKIGDITIPMFCWKVLIYSNKVEAYIIPNNHTVDQKPFTEYKTSVSSIRNASHLILPNIPNI